MFKKIAFLIPLFLMVSAVAAETDELAHAIVTPSSGTSPQDDNTKLVKSFYSLMGNSDIVAMQEMLAKNFMLQDASAAYKTANSKYDIMSNNLVERVKAMHKAMPKLEISVLETVAQGNKVAVRTMVTGFQRGSMFGVCPTNKPIAIKTFAVFTFSDGKITTINEMWNELSVMKQLGHIVL